MTDQLQDYTTTTCTPTVACIMSHVAVHVFAIVMHHDAYEGDLMITS